MEPQSRLKFSTRFFEYFVVVCVIVVVGAVSFIFLGDALAKARDAERISDIVAMRTAFELYRQDHGVYPQASHSNSATDSWDAFAEIMKPYIATLPRDPRNDSSGLVEDTGAYNYTYMNTTFGGASSYAIIFRLERPTKATLAEQVHVALAAPEGQKIYADGVYALTSPD